MDEVLLRDEEYTHFSNGQGEKIDRIIKSCPESQIQFVKHEIRQPSVRVTQANGRPKESRTNKSRGNQSQSSKHRVDEIRDAYYVSLGADCEKDVASEAITGFTIKPLK